MKKLVLIISFSSVFVLGILLIKYKDVVYTALVNAHDIMKDPCNEYHATYGCQGAHAECKAKANGPRKCKWINTGWTEVYSKEKGSAIIKCKGQCVNGHDPVPRLTPTPTNTPTSTPTTTSTATPTVTATPTGEPNYCGGTCGSNYNCQGGYFCFEGFCRNPSCAYDTDCHCDASPTAPPVLGTTAPVYLPKTGGGLEVIGVSGVLGVLGYFLTKWLK